MKIRANGREKTRPLGSSHALAIGKRNDFRQLPRDFIHVLRAQLTLILMLMLSERPGILLWIQSVGGLPLPAKSLLSETLLALAVALLLLQQLGNDRQDLPHDFVDVLLRQGPLIEPIAAAERRHWLLHVILLLRLSDNLRQDRRDLLKGVANLLLGQLALAAPILACAEGGVLAESALPPSALPESSLPEGTLTKSPLLGLLILLQSLRQLLQCCGDLWRSLRILESVLLRCFGMYHDDFPLSL
jgi:hypothetical protein